MDGKWFGWNGRFQQGGLGLKTWWGVLCMVIKRFGVLDFCKRCDGVIERKVHDGLCRGCHDEIGC